MRTVRIERGRKIASQRSQSAAGARVSFNVSGTCSGGGRTAAWALVQEVSAPNASVAFEQESFPKLTVVKAAT
jgi:hypothetical protein